MKNKIVLVILTIILVLCVLAGCGDNSDTTAPTKNEEILTTENETHNITKTEGKIPSAEKLLIKLKEKNSNLADIQVYTAENDPNGNLGRPNEYISKADFSDIRIEQIGEDLAGGTIEVFATKEDCEKRAKYLDKFTGSGLFSLNQYMYEYELAIFRVSYDLTPEQAEEYHQQMNEIMIEIENGTFEEKPTNPVETTIPTVDNTEVPTEKITEPPVVTPTEVPTELPKQEILFRGINWGTSFSDVEKLLPDLGLWGIYGEAFKTMSVDDIILGDYEGIDFEYTDINIIGETTNNVVNVAGYETSDIELYFAYVPVNGILTKEEQHSALYGARYTFEPINLKNMSDDLINKLTSL